MDNDGQKKIDLGLIFVYIGLLMFTIIYFTAGCALTPPIDVQKQAEQTYRKDMPVKVDDIIYQGTGVLPVKRSYKITIYPKEKISRVIFQNCHREIVIDKPKTGWFTNSYSIDFSPLGDVETNKLCQLEIAALNENTRNSFAFFEFMDSRPEISLRGYLKCNGTFSINDSVSLCQSAEGLTQQIYFQEETLIGEIESGCNEPETKDGFFWSFVPNKNKCSYYFVANKKHENGKRIAHRLTTLGYSSIPYPME